MSKQANQARFVELVEEHKRMLFKIASSYSRSGADQDDLIQEMSTRILAQPGWLPTCCSESS
jgi:RNA polymerase sigma-70 factor (ECF subfamily)